MLFLCVQHSDEATLPATSDLMMAPYNPESVQVRAALRPTNPVGMERFELSASCSQSRRANQAALHPGYGCASLLTVDPVDPAPQPESASIVALSVTDQAFLEFWVGVGSRL